jgi:hypothetical protein
MVGLAGRQGMPIESTRAVLAIGPFEQVVVHVDHAQASENVAGDPECGATFAARPTVLFLFLKNILTGLQFFHFFINHFCDFYLDIHEYSILFRMRVLYITRNSHINPLGIRLLNTENEGQLLPLLITRRMNSYENETFCKTRSVESFGVRPGSGTCGG